MDHPYIKAYKINYPNGETTLEKYPPVFNVDNIKKTHIVTIGETLQSIANRYYKDSGSWYRIAEYNGIIDPFEEVVEGLKIIIPL